MVKKTLYKKNEKKKERKKTPQKTYSNFFLFAIYTPNE